MGIGTRVQYTEVPISAGHVLSDGSIPHPQFTNPFQY
jgi:hypothetical protein